MTPDEFRRELFVLTTAADTLETHPEIAPVPFLRGWADKLTQIQEGEDQ